MDHNVWKMLRLLKSQGIMVHPWSKGIKVQSKIAPKSKTLWRSKIVTKCMIDRGVEIWMKMHESFFVTRIGWCMATTKEIHGIPRQVMYANWVLQESWIFPGKLGLDKIIICKQEFYSIKKLILIFILRMYIYVHNIYD